MSSAPPKSLEGWGSAPLGSARPGLWPERGQGRTQGARASWHRPWRSLPELQGAAASRQPVPFPPFISVLGSVKCEGVNSLSKQGRGRIRDVSRAVPRPGVRRGEGRRWAARSAYCVPRWAAGKAPVVGSSPSGVGWGGRDGKPEAPNSSRSGPQSGAHTGRGGGLAGPEGRGVLAESGGQGSTAGAWWPGAAWGTDESRSPRGSPGKLRGPREARRSADVSGQRARPVGGSSEARKRGRLPGGGCTEEAAGRPRTPRRTAVAQMLAGGALCQSEGGDCQARGVKV